MTESVPLPDTVNTLWNCRALRTTGRLNERSITALCSATAPFRQRAG